MTNDYRDVLLTVIRRLMPARSTDEQLWQGRVLEESARLLNIRNDPSREEALLTAWGELFRTGYLAWGLNLSNPDPPRFHLTERGRQTLAALSRDPGNPAGYLKHVSSVGQLSTRARSYLVEGLECYAAGLYKAAAVMVGAATEAMILDLRDIVVAQLLAAGETTPRGLNAWQIKTVTDSLRALFGHRQRSLSPELYARVDAFWGAFALQIRTVRNDAGHPNDMGGVTPDEVHASFLMLPELVRLTSALASCDFAVARRDES